MSVITNFRVDRRPWRGYDDPGLPSGMWIAEGEVVGDASGGFAETRFLFQIASDPLSGRLWSLEQVGAQVVANAPQNVLLRTQNMDFLTPAIPVGVHNAVLELAVTSDLTITATRVRDMFPRMFLGRPTTAGLECGLRVLFANANTVAVRAIVQGYTWEPAALLVAGGVRRPADSLWG